MKKIVLSFAAIAALLVAAWFLHRTDAEKHRSTMARGMSEAAPELVLAGPSADAADFGAAALAIPPEPELSKITAFSAWTERYLQGDAAAREALVREGAQLAAARRPELKAMIVRNPRMALDHAVS